MILQALSDLYPRLSSDSNYKISAPGFSPQKISFKVVLNDDGSLHAIEDARVTDTKGKLQNDIMEVPGSGKPSGAGVNPCLLWDNQTYLLGRQPEDKKEGFGLERFEAFRELHLSVEKSINLPAFSAVCRFLESWDPASLASHPILNDVGTGFGVFELRRAKNPVHTDPQIRKWWLDTQSTKETKATEGFCLVTGESSTIALLHPKIKGVTGAQSAGALLVSFNDRAYESLGKDQGDNAPVSEETAFRYGVILNSLLTGPQSKKHRLRIGDTTTVFWTAQPSLVEDCFCDLMFHGSSGITPDNFDSQRLGELNRLLTAIRSGANYQDFGEESTTEFFLLGLAPNAARLSVRFFHRTTTEDLLDRLHLHHKHLHIIREFSEQKGKRAPDPEFPAIWQILAETARVKDEISPLLAGALTRSITEGTAYPQNILSAIIRRIHADRTINYLRAATIKAVLTRNHHQTIPIMLDKEHPDPAYRLGCLFAALEKTQEDALGTLNAGLRDRFYGAASATPAAVFPRILRTYQHHLAKLTPGAKIAREKAIQELLAPITDFPSQLNLKKQGLFAIGYYHQRRDFFTTKESTETT